MADVNTAPLSGTDAASDAANTPFPISDPGPQIAPSQPPPAPAAADSAAPKRGVWGNILRGALYGLTNTEGQSHGAVGGIVSGITGQEPQLEAQFNQQQQSKKTLLNFESVKAADAHIKASTDAQYIAAETEQTRSLIAKDQLEANAFADQQGYPHPFSTIKGDSHEDLSNQAQGAMQANAARNGGLVGPVTATNIPHSADNPDHEIHGRQISLNDLTTNPTGVLKAINDGQIANGQLPFDSIDDAKQHYRMSNPKAPMNDLLADANQGMTRMISPMLPTKDLAQDQATVTKLQSQADFAAQYAKEHPEYQATADRLKSQLGTFSNLVQQEKSGQSKLKQSQALGDSITKMESNPEELAKPGTVASIQGMLKDPNLDPNDAPRLQALIPKAHQAQVADLDLTKTKEINSAKVKQTFDNKPVYAVDSTGKTVMTTQSAVNANTNAYTSVRPVKETDVRADQHDIKVLNDIQTKSDAVKTAASSMDSTSWGQAVGVAKYLEDHPDTTAGSITNAKILQGLRPQARTYVINVLSLRESAMGLQKVLTGSARSNDAQIKALQATLPGFESKSDIVSQKLGAFDQNLGMLSQGLPENTGVAIQVKPAQAQGTPQVGATKAFPNGKTGKWDGKGWVAQ